MARLNSLSVAQAQRQISDTNKRMADLHSENAAIVDLGPDDKVSGMIIVDPEIGILSICYECPDGVNPNRNLDSSCAICQAIQEKVVRLSPGEGADGLTLWNYPLFVKKSTRTSRPPARYIQTC